MVTQHTIDTPYPVGPVHCYTLEQEDGLILFDTGPPTPEAKEYLRHNLDLNRLRHVLVTHCHIDHYGLAHWLEQETDATIYLPHRDGLKIDQHERRMKLMYALLNEVGFGHDYLADLQKMFAAGVLFPPPPKKFKIAEENLPVELGITAIPCPGHSQSDVVYTFGNYAVTGDTLLRGIFQSPLLDVDLLTGKRFNNYHAYCDSIIKLARLEDKTVLPGHRQSIDSVSSSLQFYIGKMLTRVEQMLPVREEKNVARLIGKLFNNSMNDVFHIYLKASEILFMQDFLAEPEKLEEALAEIGLLDIVAPIFGRVTGR
ncbi:MBL fold metallo-hydrolase [Desulfopila aestuarii]|uniref:Glyoxylase, beta-lactamase superfamily II n=1 Tax=Desulfopila aestuarii DSM 18488 TaxID=1121416 RepID=A0A1M7Y597_9BACT|nr:MBL fold metallo-hydrolase [Desulfopila aestuarii]SHO47593.1 Glyoxylase, beta-lactamase superfamily II [Desulfopila aestuarii DSM 18488]